MPANIEDNTLRQHLDAVDRYERKYKRNWIGAIVVCMSLYAAFFYFAVHDEGRTQPVGVLFGLMLAFAFAGAINGLYFHITRMTNRILKAIELLAREQK
jgi:hypothetical protein